MARRKLLSLLILGVFWPLVGCSDSSSQGLATSSSEIGPTTVETIIEIGRETLLALTKCQSESGSANTAAELNYPSALKVTAEVCIEAKEQLGVERELNPAFEAEIENLMTELEFWILTLEVVAFELEFGDGPTTSFRAEEGAVIREIESFLKLLNP